MTDAGNGVVSRDGYDLSLVLSTTSHDDGVPYSSFAAFRFGKDIYRVGTGNVCISDVMSSCLQRQEHLDSVS